MKKIAFLHAMLAIACITIAQTNYYVIHQEYDANGFPLLEQPRQTGSYYTFSGNYMYMSNANGVKTGVAWVFDGKTDNNGYRHYIPYDEVGVINMGYLSQAQINDLKQRKAIIDRNSFGEFLISPDKNIMFQFYGIGVPKGGSQEYRKSNPPSSNQTLPRIPKSPTSSSYNSNQRQNTYPTSSNPTYTNPNPVQMPVPQKTFVKCAACNGSGKCRTCAGRGEYRNSITNILYDCGVCHGGGKCVACRGTGGKNQWL